MQAGAFPPTPLEYPSGLPGPGCYWCLPPSLGAPCAAWLPCILLGLLFVLCFCSSSSLWHQRPLPCVGLQNPLHHFWCVEAVLSISALRYSSLMIQDSSGRLLKHVSTPSGSCVPFLPLSYAAAWPPSPLSFVLGCPCVGVFVLPLLLCLSLIFLGLVCHVTLRVYVSMCSPFNCR